MTAVEPTWQRVSRAIAGCLVVVLGLAILVYLIYGAWHIFVGLQKEVAASLITASAAVLVSLVSILGARYFEANRERAQRLREKKVDLYEEFVRFMLGEFFLGGADQEAKNEKLKEYFPKMTAGFVSWADDEVMVRWSQFRSGLANQPTGQPTGLGPMLAFEKVLLAIRKDLGHLNRGLQPGDLLRFFINDVDKLMGPRKP